MEKTIPSSILLPPPSTKEGEIVQALVSGAGAFLAEGGMVLKGQKLPVLGRAGIVGLVSAVSALLGLIAGRAVDAGGKDVFDRFGHDDGVVDSASMIIDATSAFVLGSLASYVLARSGAKMDAMSRSALVGLAVAASSMAGDWIVSKYE